MPQDPSRAPHGVALVDKPAGRTSHDVVAWARRSLGTRKVGHAGTLDPMATGLLVLGVGQATRLLTFLVGEDKEYLATIRLGQTTTTEDAEGELLETADPDRVDALDAGRLAEAMAALAGEHDQVPSAVSAIKVDGVRAYQRVRAGERVELEARRVTIREFERLGLRRETLSAGAGGAGADGAEASGGRAVRVLDVDVRVVCTSGTYIRALARDLGEALGVGAHLTALRRTRVGEFRVEEARATDDPLPRAALLPSAEVAGRRFGVLRLGDREAIDLGHGKRIPVPDGAPEGEGPFAGLAPDGRLVGLVAISGRSAKSILNFPAEDRPERERGAGA